MRSFLDYLTTPDPAGNECPVCGSNRYTCDCGDTPVEIVVMADRDGRVVGKVMKGSIAHRVMLSNRYIEVKGDES